MINMGRKNDLLLIVSYILILAGSLLFFFQNRTLEKYKDILSNVDTTAVVVKHDTIYTDRDTTITQPIVIKETILRIDTLYTSDGDTVDVKKKTKLIPIQ